MVANVICDVEMMWLDQPRRCFYTADRYSRVMALVYASCGMWQLCCRDDLARPAQTLFLHNLTGILETAIRATNAQYDDTSILQRLDVRLLEVFIDILIDIRRTYRQ